MGHPYSFDLRKKIIDDVDNGMSQIDAAKKFKVSRTAIGEWLKLRSESNSLAPKTGYQKGHSHKITDWDEFAKFVEENKFSTGQEMANKWSALKNINMCTGVIYLALSKIGYTFKKKPFVMQKANWKNSKNS